MRIFILVLIAILGECAATKPVTSLSLQATRHLEKYMMEAYEESGLRGIQIYFNDRFQAHYYGGHVLNKTQFFNFLAKETYRAVFDSIRETYFENGDLIVSYYFGQVQYDARLLANRALLGGFEFIEIRPST